MWVVTLVPCGTAKKKTRDGEVTPDVPRSLALVAQRQELHSLSQLSQPPQPVAPNPTSASNIAITSIIFFILIPPEKNHLAGVGLL